jgi:predicted ATPase
VEDARAADHPISLCNALGLAAFPVALYIGDLRAAEGYLRHLLDHLARNPLAVWRSLGDCLEGMLMIERGELAGVARMEDALERLRAAGICLRRSYLLGALARGQARTGRLSDALATIEEALVWCERTGERWFLPEVLRLKGEFLRASASNDSVREEAERCYQEAIDWSRRQGALAWELRATTSLAELYLQSNRHGEAAEMLRSVHSRFTEGFETADLQKARALIACVTESS